MGLNRATMDDQVRKRKAAELAALKLDWTRKLEEARWEVMLLDLDQYRSVRPCCYCCSNILDISATVGSLPFGVNVLTITGIPCDSCLVSSSSETPVI